MARLIQAAQESTSPFRGLTGPDRAILYLTACATGYRAGELAKLTPTHFDLDAEVPVARMDRKGTKNKKAAEQPIPPAVARQLREYFVGKSPKEPIWPGTWWDRAADMLKDDLAAAGIAVETEEGDALFHSLKHTYTTMLAQVAPVKVTQELSRHSTPVLTLGRYTHAGMAEKAEAVGKLPLPGSDVARGPFSGMPRAELEAVAEYLLGAALACTQFAPRFAPDSGNPGDSLGPTGTKEPARHPPGRKKKRL